LLEAKTTPIGGPTPENSAGVGARLPRDSHGSSDDEGARGFTNAATSPVGKIKLNSNSNGSHLPDQLDASPRPWLQQHATGRRSNRARVVNDSFCQRFEAAEAGQLNSNQRLGLVENLVTNARPRNEHSPGLTKPQPSRGGLAPINLDDSQTPTLIHAPKPRVPLPPHLTAAVLAESGRPVTATPPPHLLGTVRNAAELLIGSPGAGMAAADTLLQMLMMGPADSPSIEKGASPATVGAAAAAAVAAVTKTAQRSAARSGNVSRSRTTSSLAPKKRSRSVPDATEGARVGAQKKGRRGTHATHTNPPPPADDDEDEDVHRIVPETAMYHAASAAAAKRRMLPSRGGGRQKVHRPWTLPEVEALVEGVGHYGRGQWADIKSLESDGVAEALVSRSAVDLKDKWRNLLRIAMLPVLYKRREATEIPPALLAKVRELAAQKGSPGRSGTETRESSPETSPDGTAGANSEPNGPKGVRRSKHHSPWTLTESKALVDGVDAAGGCRWTVIKKLGLESLERRTAMDLKDKWRNLLQLASLPQQSRRKAETPPELLQRVLYLEAKYGTARRKGRKSAAEETTEV